MTDNKVIKRAVHTAEDELIEALAGAPIVCASVQYGDSFHGGTYDFAVNLHLPIGYSTEQLEDFMNNLRFSYDSGYGTQELFGTVWLEGGKWLERGEYDGSEWWELKEYPEIPEELRKEVEQ